MSSSSTFSDYIVYVDESGHASPDPDPNYPCFVLAFCLFEKSHYLSKVVRDLQQIKFDLFGHDMVIFHEREIRKRLDDFTVLNDPTTRDAFYERVNRMIEAAEMQVIHSTILKEGSHLPEDNLYHIALSTCLEQLYSFLKNLGAQDHPLHIIFEARGKNEDRELELEFLRICNGENKDQKKYPFHAIIASKKANSTGLQFADLVARPYGLHRIRPQQANRAYDILSRKALQTTYQQSDLDL